MESPLRGRSLVRPADAGSCSNESPQRDVWRRWPTGGVPDRIFARFERLAPGRRASELRRLGALRRQQDVIR
jgi:hypothetical protein